MKKIHWFHDWEKDGFESYGEGGYSTTFFKKCACGAQTSHKMGNRPSEWTFKFFLLVWICSVGVVVFIGSFFVI